jgi:hypothetical protein
VCVIFSGFNANFLKRTKNFMSVTVPTISLLHRFSDAI